MTHEAEQVWCVRCGAEIDCAPVAIDGRLYCCADCAAGRPCECGERMGLGDERRGARTAADRDSVLAGG